MGIDDAMNDMANLIRVFDKYWLDIDKALCYSNRSHSVQDVMQRVAGGSAYLHELDNSIIITEIVEHPNHSVYHVFIACGDLDEVLDFVPIMEAEAKTFGCSYLSFTGRLGWHKVLKDKGWSTQLVTAYKEVQHGQD